MNNAPKNRYILLTIGVTALLLGIHFGIMYIASFVGGILWEVQPMIGMALYLLLYSMAFFWLLGLVLQRAVHMKPEEIGFVQNKMGLKLALGLGVGVAVFALTALPLYLTGVYELGEGYGIAAAIVGIFDYIIVGIGEETVCRGFLQHRLMRRTSRINALFITAGVFSLLHFFNPGFTFVSLVNIFLAGVFMGAVMLATGSIWAAIGVHITWNWMQGSVLGIPVSGGERTGFFTTLIAPSSADIVSGGSFGAEGSIVCTAVLAIACLATLLIANKQESLTLSPKAPGIV